MPARYKKSKPRRYRKTKKFTRSRRYSRAPRVKPDGMIKEKVTIELPIRADASGSGYLNIHWHSNFIGSPTDSYNVGYESVLTTGAVSQFTQQSRNYEKYKIYGMKFEYMPY